LDTPFCNCEFAKKYYLPCKHVFLFYLYQPDFLKDQHWDIFADGWEESGYEIYETKEAFYVPRPVYDPVRESAVVNRFKEGIKTLIRY